MVIVLNTWVSIYWLLLCIRRPLKLTGWELWLCGESNGPLFAPADGDGDIATAFDGSDASTSVVKKAVTTSKSVDVNVLIKSAYRAEQVAQDPINHVSAVKGGWWNSSSVYAVCVGRLLGVSALAWSTVSCTTLNADSSVQALL